ncbi:IS66 family transposase [Vibrio splendidus]|uniref:IS66 family transposase n=1 Tax=Vibrio splendidus TaxID=29497 RepID=UPI000D39F151
MRYVEDGYLFIDNNRAERVIKPLVIGQNTGCSPDTTKILTQCCSITETKKANDLIVYDYLVK